MRLVIVISFLLAAPQLAGAQFPAEVQPGTRVRVWIPETVRQEQEPIHRQLLRGTVESVDRGILRLEVPGTAGSLAIPRAAVRRLDVSLPHRLAGGGSRRGVGRGDWCCRRVGLAIRTLAPRHPLNERSCHGMVPHRHCRTPNEA